MNVIDRGSALIVAGVLATLLSGWGLALGLAVADADSKQKPAVTTYDAPVPTDRLFTAATQAMGAFGKITSSDRTSGTVQGEKGSWVVNASVTAAATGGGSRLQTSARFVPGQRLDMNSRENLTKDYLALVEEKLGRKLVAAQ